MRLELFVKGQEKVLYDFECENRFYFEQYY
ncbi:hypothetical protein J2S09_004368 [Bacillus fengqiuensis]|nr:hypothetical protein [Bacillus fengqiuensis]